MNIKSLIIKSIDVDFYQDSHKAFKLCHWSSENPYSYCPSGMMQYLLNNKTTLKYLEDTKDTKDKKSDITYDFHVRYTAEVEEHPSGIKDEVIFGLWEIAKVDKDKDYRVGTCVAAIEGDAHITINDDDEIWIHKSNKELFQAILAEIELM